MSIGWISVSKELPRIGNEVLIFVRGGSALGKLTSNGWVYFNGYTEVANSDGTLTQYVVGEWPPEFWAPLTRP